MDDEEECPSCPLCLEELDATDRAVKACQCGYQVCLWCLHHIREQLNGKCPACRTKYEETNFKFDEVNPELAAKEAKERANAKKERERREKVKAMERERARAVAVSQQKAKTNLKHVRMIQRNLVYIIGLSLTLAREEVLRRSDMFGKFGRLLRVLVNRSHPYNADAPGGPSISAYIQYARDCDASSAVRLMNNAVFDGREIRCAIATTKYCDAFVRSGVSEVGVQRHCGNPDCMYYHELCQPDDMLSREEVLGRQLGPPPPAHLFVGQGPSQGRRPSGRSAAAAAPSRSRPQGGNSSSSSRLPSSSSSAPAPSGSRRSGGQSRRSPPASPDARRRGAQAAKSPVRTAPAASAPQTSVPLPSTAGWASSQPTRAGIRSPVRTAGARSPVRVSPTADLARPKMPAVSAPVPAVAAQPLKPDPQVQRSKPPGFERLSPKLEAVRMPSRPPGFDEPARVSHNIVSVPEPSAIPVPTALVAPPGFGRPGATVTSTASASMNPVISHMDPSVAMWAQEASADQIVPSQDRARSGIPSRPVGAPPRTHDQSGSLESTLARMKLKTGVGSEILHFSTNPGAVGSQTGIGPGTIGNAFGSQQSSHAPGSGQFPSVGFPGGPATCPAPGFGGLGLQSRVVGTGRYGDGSLPARQAPMDIHYSKRSNSRFGFARETPEPVPQAVPLPTTNQFNAGIMDYGASNLAAGLLSGNLPLGNTNRIQQHSRFDFVERPAPAPQPPPVQPGFGSAYNQRSVGMQPDLRHVGSNTTPAATTSSFAQLSTAEKLASIFQNAQLSPEQLPPMPIVGSGGLNNAQRDVTLLGGRKGGSDALHLGSVLGSNAINTEKAVPSMGRASETVPSLPPGFREATSGKPPESAVEEATLTTTTGVAATAENGGGYESSSVNGEEGIESGVESVEGDRKRSRAQRKRDKKARQKKEAVERREAAERRMAFAKAEAEKRAAASQKNVPPAVPVSSSTPASNAVGATTPTPLSAPLSVPTPRVPVPTSTMAAAASAPAQAHVSQQEAPLRPVAAVSTPLERMAERRDLVVSLHDGPVVAQSGDVSDDTGHFMSVSELEREVKAARAREAQLQSRLVELQRRIRSYDNIRI